MSGPDTTLHGPVWASPCGPPTALPCPLCLESPRPSSLSGVTCYTCWEMPPRPHCGQGHPAGSEKQCLPLQKPLAKQTHSCVPAEGTQCNSYDWEFCGTK